MKTWQLNDQLNTKMQQEIATRQEIHRKPTENNSLKRLDSQKIWIDLTTKQKYSSFKFWRGKIPTTDK